jgi:hypothetical protein
MGSGLAGRSPRLAAVSAAALAAALAGPLAAGAGASGAEVSYLGAGRVAWTGVAEVGEDGGSAGLPVFSPSYENVESSDGSNVVAPGTSGELSVRVTNASGHAVGYSASAALGASGLPVEAEAPEALSGTLEPGASVELSLPWSWGFSSGDAGDERDTALGDAAAGDGAATVSASVSVAFEEPDGTVPRTGDASADGAALAASGLALAAAGAALALRSRSGRRS